MEPLKNHYNEQFIRTLGFELNKHCAHFNENDFLATVMDDEWSDKELKARMRHISTSIHKHLGDNYKENIQILKLAAPKFNDWMSMIFADYVEVHGLEDYDTSIDALEYFTKFSSSEFAIRPFIKMDEERTMKKMLEWSTNENYHIRRLASEGCRPRLPWAMALPKFKNDPSPILPILHNLKQDPQLYVRKSVANNLNDIAKDNPEITIDTAEKWHAEKNSHSLWIIKHGCRTLLKQSEPRALHLFGFTPLNITAPQLILSAETFKIGDELRFEFSATCKKTNSKLRVEYAVDYVKKNGSTNRKIFQISERDETPMHINFTRKQSLANMSTRTHYAGIHGLTIIVNGHKVISKKFSLTN